MDMPEIVVTKHGTAMGPIIPIIPLNKDTNFETQQLEIKITVLGNSDEENYSPEAATIALYTRGKPIAVLSKGGGIVSETKKNNKAGRLWVQYGFTYKCEALLGQIQDLTISLHARTTSPSSSSLHRIAQRHPSTSCSPQRRENTSLWGRPMAQRFIPIAPTRNWPSFLARMSLR